MFDIRLGTQGDTEQEHVTPKEIKMNPTILARTEFALLLLDLVGNFKEVEGDAAAEVIRSATSVMRYQPETGPALTLYRDGSYRYVVTRE